MKWTLIVISQILIYFSNVNSFSQAGIPKAYLSLSIDETIHLLLANEQTNCVIKLQWWQLAGGLSIHLLLVITSQPLLLYEKMPITLL